LKLQLRATRRASSFVWLISCAKLSEAGDGIARAQQSGYGRAWGGIPGFERRNQDMDRDLPDKHRDELKDELTEPNATPQDASEPPDLDDGLDETADVLAEPPAADLIADEAVKDDSTSAPDETEDLASVADDSARGALRPCHA
jgi:hypothetical protein